MGIVFLNKKERVIDVSRFRKTVDLKNKLKEENEKLSSQINIQKEKHKNMLLSQEKEYELQLVKLKSEYEQKILKLKLESSKNVMSIKTDRKKLAEPIDIKLPEKAEIKNKIEEDISLDDLRFDDLSEEIITFRKQNKVQKRNFTDKEKELISFLGLGERTIEEIQTYYTQLCKKIELVAVDSIYMVISRLNEQLKLRGLELEKKDIGNNMRSYFINPNMIQDKVKIYAENF